MIWIAFTVLGACLPLGHPGIPDKADTPAKAAPTQPEKSACEFHVEQLQDEIDSLREMLRDVAPGDACYCGED